MSAQLPTETCPYCPGSRRIFSKHGLKVHIGRMHKNEPCLAVPPQVPATDARQVHDIPAQVLVPLPCRCPLESIAALKVITPVLRHIPKGARNQAAGKLSDVINGCVECDRVEDWFSLLSFAYNALRVPSSSLPGSMTTKIKANIEAHRSVQYDDNLGMNAERIGPRCTRKLIESKVFEGDLRGAVRLLVSDDSFAQHEPGTLAALELKHPAPSRPLGSLSAPDPSTCTLTATVDSVSQALSSFYSGSAAGLDGIRPGHLKELTSRTAGENGRRLLESLTKLSNFMLSGRVNPEIRPYLYGAALCALSKKGGGLRPIAMGSVFRRLTAKLACHAVREEMSLHLQPHQLGFGTRLGCEAAIHATRVFAMDPVNADCVILKLDVRNAFNTLERDVLLSEVRERIPHLYPFIYSMYESPSNLFFNKDLILSQVGAQQGDPLGPLIFSLAIHKVITDLKSTLNVWYLDDGTLGGDAEAVRQDLLMLIPRLKQLGLEVNPSKCEFFPCGTGARSHFTSFSSILPGLNELSHSSFTLLGSPIFLEAVPDAIASRRQLLLTAEQRLQGLPAHVALVLLRSCFALPRINFLLRTAPTWLYPEEISAFDGTLKCAAESILNVSLNEAQWTQASLPIRLGGLGLRRAQDVGLPAFLASAHGVAGLVTVIIPSSGDGASLPYVSDAMVAWSARNSGAPSPVSPCIQRAWDDVDARRTQSVLLEDATGADCARLKAVAETESGAWLHALPSPYIGTFLDDDSLRVAVALRIGCRVCEPHKCICGSMVDANGYHALSCRRCTGRFPRHHALNDIVRRAFVSANIPCVLEPPGLSRSDGKRPDGLTLVPWKHGRCVVWDATCVNTVAASYLGRTVSVAAAAAEEAAEKKRLKYAAMEPHYCFVPIAVETMGCWGKDAKSLFRELGHKVGENTGDSRSGTFLVQRMAIAIQRGNAASVLGTFAPETLQGGY